MECHPPHGHLVLALVGFSGNPTGPLTHSRQSERSFTTSGMSSEFDRRLGLMLEQGEFDLLTSRVNLVTRNQYMMCWKRRSSFCACMDVSPWLVTSQVGWGNALIDFIVWECKLMGIQQSTIGKRFFSIRLSTSPRGSATFPCSPFE